MINFTTITHEDILNNKVDSIESKQYVSFQYKHPAKAKDFNTLLKGAVQPGIYEGGELEIYNIEEGKIKINPFILYCITGKHTIARVETLEEIILSIDPDYPVIYALFEFEGNGELQDYENYISFGRRGLNDNPVTNEIIFGECKFTDMGELCAFTYNQRMDQPTSGYDTNKGFWVYESVNKEKIKNYISTGYDEDRGSWQYELIDGSRRRVYTVYINGVSSSNTNETIDLTTKIPNFTVNNIVIEASCTMTSIDGNTFHGQANRINATSPGWNITLLKTTNVMYLTTKNGAANIPYTLKIRYY